MFLRVSYGMAPGLKEKTKPLLQSTCFAVVASKRYILKKPKQSWRDSSAHRVLASCPKDLSSDPLYPYKKPTTTE